ncbi:mycothiol synthase [Corynebacterium caspium]|uniref:mycothiol synthase n=1 Tax=Corynebacterium caspium TaxID=234828 RepID=UPI00035DEBEA|nr:mycothiol synthase [Corynebacterium caspium]WKD58755.1 Mycothiol acetyltransferase [Corynebacterium caspium DSM 44850]
MELQITQIALAQASESYRVQVLELLARAHETDGVEAFSEQFVLGLTDAALNHQHYLAMTQHQILGLAAVAPGLEPTAELVVHPHFRSQHIASQLAATIAPIPLWAHGDLPAAQALAKARGGTALRKLLVMQLKGASLSTVASAIPELPAGFAVVDLPCALDKWGREVVLAELLKVNNEAFDWHPEQGNWSLERLERGLNLPWFDPAGLLFLVDTRAAGVFRLAGFHWTKWQPPVGEVYVVGLADAYRGQGLGRAIVNIGLHYLFKKQPEYIELYVEADNTAAVEVYKRLGFVVSQTHVLYSNPR